MSRLAAVDTLCRWPPVDTLPHSEPLPPMCCRSDDTFWCTTGLFPQVIILGNSGGGDVERVQMACSDVRRVQVEACNESSPSSHDDGWTTVHEAEFERADRQLENMQFSPCPARFLKLTIHSACV